MQLKAVFVRNLKKYRKFSGISQMTLTEMCDTSTSYIGQIEIGNRFPSLNLIEKIAQALQIKPYLLFVDELIIVPGTSDRRDMANQGKLVTVTRL
jgi:transcriptional regulator with XRE-family HTH domain